MNSMTLMRLVKFVITVSQYQAVNEAVQNLPRYRNQCARTTTVPTRLVGSCPPAHVQSMRKEARRNASSDKLQE